MGNALEFMLKLTDMLSPGMRQAAAISDSTAVKIQAEFDKINKGGRQMGASVNELRARLDAVNKVRFGTTIEREFNIATRAANRLERQIEDLERKGKPGGGSGGLGMGGLVKGNLISDGITSAAGWAKDQIVDVYQTALQSSSLKTAINATTGGQGKEAVAMTSSLADKYGLNYEASLEGVKTLTGGLKSMNLPLQDQMKIFEGVSTGIAAMKLGAEESKGAMLALGQMASKGTVSAEELRGQLGERIPGAFGIAAQAMGVTESKLNDMLQKGEIASKDFLPKFAAQMQKTFGADALAAANGPQAIQERFNNAVFKMKATVGEGLMPVFTPVLQKLTELATAVMPYLMHGVNFIVQLFTGILSPTSEWAFYVNWVKDIAGRIFGVFSTITKTMWTIVGGVYEWLAKSQIIKDVFSVVGWVGGVIFEMVKGISSVLVWIWDNIIKPVLNAIEWVYNKVRSLLGIAAEKPIEITAQVNTAASQEFMNKMTPGLMQMGGQQGVAPLLPGLGGPKGLTPVIANNAPGTQPAAADNKMSKEAEGKADSINQGGQRSIIINIAKQVGVEEIHVMGAGEIVSEIESAVREAMRRMVYSLNGVAPN